MGLYCQVKPSGIEKAFLVDFVDHESKVMTVDINQEKNTVISGAADGKIYLGDIRTGSAVRDIQAHSTEVTCVKFLHDGRIVSTGLDHSLRLFDSRGQELYLFDMGEPLLNLCVKNDRVLFGTESGILKGWDLMASNEIYKSPKESSPVSALFSSPKGDVVVAGYDNGTVSYWALD